MTVPAQQLSCGPAHLRRWRRSDLGALAAASRASWRHLRPWMPWAQDEPDEQSTLPFLEGAETGWGAGTAFQYAIVGAPGSSQVLGSCGLMRRIDQGGLEIGYWVHVDHTGRGLATAAAAALTAAGFALADVTHLEIHMDEANAPSRRVPARLGYRHVATRRRDREAPGEVGRDQIWRLTRGQWPTNRAAARWDEQVAAGPLGPPSSGPTGPSSPHA